MMGLKSELEKLCRGTAVVCCFLSIGTAHERTHDEMKELQSLLSSTTSRSCETSSSASDRNIKLLSSFKGQRGNQEKTGRCFRELVQEMISFDAH